MKRTLALLLLSGGLTVGLAGCGEKASTTTETTVTTPEGSTTTTETREVETTGENPPPAN
jgi:hypothetical protein